jgi:peptide deformylase
LTTTRSSDLAAVEGAAGPASGIEGNSELRAAAHRGVGVAVRGEHDHLAGRLVADRLAEEIREGAMRGVEVR